MARSGADFSPGVGDDAAEQIPPEVAAAASAAVAAASSGPPAQPFTRSTQKVGRNDPCPCGSGKKFKQCHGKLA